MPGTNPATMERAVLLLHAGLGLLSRTLCAIAGLMAFAMMLITVIDVGGRYLFSHPLPGAYELVEMLMVPLVYLAIAAPESDGGHIRTSLLPERAPLWFSRFTLIVSELASCVMVALLAWRAFIYGFDTWSHQEASIILHLPRAPLHMAMGVGLSLLAAYFLVNALAAILNVTLPKRIEQISEPERGANFT